MPVHLPIDDVIPELLQVLKRHGSAVVVAPPGAGKTTRIPPALDEAGLLVEENRGIAVLQPRRVAARATANRIASERGWRIGNDIGWQIRHEDRTGPQTRIRVMTEGVLTRWLLRDPSLDGIGCVVLDEFHERSIHSDLALAFLKEVRSAVRPDLKLIVMSATLDPSPVSSFLDHAPVIKSHGRTHDVSIQYLERRNRQRYLEDDVLAAIQRTLLRDFEETGHLLVFLPGMREIRRVRDRLDTKETVCVLHGSVSPAEQDAAVTASATRRVILATNIAETSLTIDGVRTVIDSGLARVANFDPVSGIDRLELKRISLASANQRAGRAGRTAPGVCIRLWPKAEDALLAENQLPEVQRIDIAPAVMAVKSWGSLDVEAFTWYERPAQATLHAAERLLAMVGAVESGGRLTARGRRIAHMPVHPRLGALLLEGESRGLPQAAAVIAALASEDELAPPRRDTQHTGLSDIVARVESFERGDFPHLQRVRDELLRLLQSRSDIPENDEDMLRLILRGWPDRVTKRREPGSNRAVMAGGRGAVLAESSCVRHSDLFVSVCVQGGGGNEAVVTAASGIELSWLREEFPNRFTTGFVHEYDEEKERVISLKRTLFQDLVLEEHATGPQSDPQGASQTLADALGGRAKQLFSRDEVSNRFLQRFDFLRNALPEENLEAFDLSAVLVRACAEKHSLAQISSGGLVNLLRNETGWNQQRLLDAEAPERIKLPSGRAAVVEYPEDPKQPPVLAARVQELFGMMEAPKVAKGRIQLLVHLLGPNYRPVQITRDLSGFWQRTYHDVRKELRARYPKHSWPDDPTTAKPIAGTRRKP